MAFRAELIAAMDCGSKNGRSPNRGYVSGAHISPDSNGRTGDHLTWALQCCLSFLVVLGWNSMTGSSDPIHRLKINSNVTVRVFASYILQETVGRASILGYQSKAQSGTPGRSEA